MTWWCASVDRPWDWTPRPYFGVWLLCGSILAGYVWWGRRQRRRGAEVPTRRQRWQFVGGVAFLWIASDWPVGALGGGYLSSVHMLQYLLYTLGAAPLLMLGTPESLARAVLRRLGLGTVWRALTRPVIAAAAANLLLIVTHSPFLVDPLRASQIGSFVLDMLWLLSGLVMWAPLINPVRDERVASPLVKIVYLFVAAALVPMIPGGFIAFAAHPLYSTYELAPRMGISALHDQQFAGVLMKIGNVPIIWAVMGVIWFRWYETDRAGGRPRGTRRVGAGVPTDHAADATAGTGSRMTFAPTAEPRPGR